MRRYGRTVAMFRSIVHPGIILNSEKHTVAPRARPPFTSRPRFSAAGNTLAFAVEFHGALADREVGGRLDLLHERRRLGVCLKLAAFGRGLVHVREDHRRRLDEVIDGVGAGLEEARVWPEVDHGQTRLVEIADARLQ